MKQRTNDKYHKFKVHYEEKNGRVLCGNIKFYTQYLTKKRKEISCKKCEMKYVAEYMG